MAFFSSQRDYMRRSPSKDNIKHSQRYPSIGSPSSSHHVPSLPSKTSPNPQSSSKRNHDQTHVMSQTIPAQTIRSLDSSPTRPPSSGARSDTNGSTLKSINRVPVPTEAALLARDSDRSTNSTPSSLVGKSMSLNLPSDSYKSNANGSDTSSTKGGGRGSDTGNISGGFGISSRIDLKRLMSKPAQSTTSLNSNISGSEASIRIHRSERQGSSGEVLVNVATTTITITSEATMFKQPIPMPPPSPRDSEISKPRNVLRRKPSTKGLSPPNTAPVRVQSHSPLKRNTDTNSPLATRRSASSPGHSRAMTNTKLTPAGAVAAAYKEQEQNKGKRTSVSRVSHTEAEDSSTGPYYTVFGGTSDKVIAAGGTADDRWSSDLRGYNRERWKSGSSSTNQNESSGSSFKKLSRKVSGRWKKASGGGGVVVLQDNPNANKSSSRYERPSLQERRSASMPHDGRKSLGLSIDGFVDVKPLGSPRSGPPPSTMNGKSAIASGWPSDAFETPRPKDKSEESSTGGKLWKLVKRISTGGLKDKYVAHGSTSSPPPVPALPKNLKDFSPSPRQIPDTPYSVHGKPLSEQMSPLPRCVTGRSSFSGCTRPLHISNPYRSASGPPVSHSSERCMQRPSTAGAKPAASSQPINGRPSTTTRSSSPDSSDMASSKFWNRARSARSSLSSYGEEVPPVPKPVFGQPILSPSELCRLERVATDGESLCYTAESPTKSPTSQPSPLRATAFPSLDNRDKSDRSTELIRPSLPIPPRRNPHHHHNQTSPAPFSSSTRIEVGSPISFTFPTKDAVNQHTQPSQPILTISTSRSTSHSPLPQAEFGMASLSPPPPRPVKSARRMTSISPVLPTSGPCVKDIVISSPMHLSPLADESRDYGQSGNRIVSQQCDRSGSGNISTTKRRGSAASASNKSSASSPARSPLRFREIGSSSKKHAWTEKEKADRWDDLLEMSEQAGGTIHLGDGELLSDSIRYSVATIGSDQAVGESD